MDPRQNRLHQLLRLHVYGLRVIFSNQLAADGLRLISGGPRTRDELIFAILENDEGPPVGGPSDPESHREPTPAARRRTGARAVRTIGGGAAPVKPDPRT
jgi:hypothetical protein